MKIDVSKYKNQPIFKITSLKASFLSFRSNPFRAFRVTLTHTKKTPLAGRLVIRSVGQA